MSHHHHHGNCEHESSDSDYLKEIGVQYGLYQKIDLENLDCLNETTDGSGKLVFKPYEDRLNFEKVKLLSIRFSIVFFFYKWLHFSLLKVMLTKSSSSIFRLLGMLNWKE